MAALADVAGPGGRVVVTGLGALSALGDSVEGLWAGLLAADHEPVRRTDAWCPADDPTPTYVVPAGAARRARGAHPGSGAATAHLGHAVAAALDDAGLGPDARAAAATVVGTGLGDVDRLEARYERGLGPGPAEPAPHAVAARTAHRFGLGGELRTVSTACSAGATAVAEAAAMVAGGGADVVVTGGVEAHSRVARGSLERLFLLDPVRCRPFDADRVGMVLGEGAAVLVLESAAHARRRGARVLAELLGTGLSCDAHNLVGPRPDGDGIARAVRDALQRAGRPTTAVGALVPHRSGIADLDAAEATALARVWGAAPLPPASSPKAVLGHTGGAAGAFACLLAVLMVRTGLVPPTAHVERPDPACPLHTPRDGPVALGPPAVLVTGSSFGGNNAAILLGRSAS